MASDTKQRMIEGAVRLLAARGLHKTSFTEVLQATGAPRGSIYHHFPEGKDQLISLAVGQAGANAIDLMKTFEGQKAAEVADRFLSLWRNLLIMDDFRSGCSVLAVTVGTDSPELLGHASEVFSSWRAILTELLSAGGLHPSDAAGFAALLIASTEGAVAVSRAARSIEPFEFVADELVRRAALYPRV
ncbi:TetR family transcriptional regulator [Rhodococcus erythropolis]|uniref:TetR family transcriptional regulator n=1 Tax=Rhodococcus erythropolis TaxID=1833 RepID=A0A5N5DVL4_RHOER|nr:TetR family transcriptional regulator [Rhodococcus erythropolis]